MKSRILSKKKPPRAQILRYFCIKTKKIRLNFSIYVKNRRSSIEAKDGGDHFAEIYSDFVLCFKYETMRMGQLRCDMIRAITDGI